MCQHQITVLPANKILTASDGENLLQLLRQNNCAPDAPCGGNGTCGKCLVYINSQKSLACQTVIHNDMTVRIPDSSAIQIMDHGLDQHIQPDGQDRYVLAYDIGTTTIVCYLLDGSSGQELAYESILNPQTAYGADVISRIEYVLQNGPSEIQSCITDALSELARKVADKAGISASEITLACVVGNTAMHHLFLGIDPAPLTTPPYMPKVSNAMEIPAAPLLPVHPEGKLRILPNIAGFVGADTVSCMTALRFDQLEELTLMIDIGTNGEMVLGNKDRLACCSTAAGPAFEGAKIECGMRGAAGAVDHVEYKDGKWTYTTVGNAAPVGLCGSGLIDLVAQLYKAELIDEGGHLESGQETPGVFVLVPPEEAGNDKGVYLTQKDVGEVQLAKAAIAAGIESLEQELGITEDQISKVYIAGAFGNYMNPQSACEIGMIPFHLKDKIIPVGNAAGEGAKIALINEEELLYADKLAKKISFVELAASEDFQDCFVVSLFVMT